MITLPEDRLAAQLGLAYEMGQTVGAEITALVDVTLKGAIDRNVLIGPACWDPSRGEVECYFEIITGRKAPKGVYIARFKGESDVIDALRSMATAYVIEHYNDRLVQLFEGQDGEAQMGRELARLWPTDFTRRLCKRLQQPEKP